MTMSSTESFLLGIFVGLVAVAAVFAIDSALNASLATALCGLAQKTRQTERVKSTGGANATSNHDIMILLDTGNCGHCHNMMNTPEGQAKLEQFTALMAKHDIKVRVEDLSGYSDSDKEEFIQKLSDNDIVIQYVPCILATCKSGNILAIAGEEFTSCLHDGEDVPDAAGKLHDAVKNAGDSGENIKSSGGATVQSDSPPPAPDPRVSHDAPPPRDQPVAPAQTAGQFRPRSRCPGRGSNAVPISRAF